MLVLTSGLDSGLMIVQYTAAALVSDNKTLAHPDSVDSIPTCANQEDHVSMGPNAARHALEIIDNVRHVISLPLILSILSAVVLFLLAVRHEYALICFSISVFVLATIFMEFWRGARVRRSQLGESPLRALVNLTARNPRRYGGYIVHFGIVLIFVGIAGSSYNEKATAELGIGETMAVGGYELRIDSLDEGVTPNYDYASAVISLLRGGAPVASFEPERRFYRASEQPSSEVEIHSTFTEDVYLVYASMGNSGGAVIQVYRNPLVRWVWIGGIVLVLGTLICLVPTAGRQTR